MESMDARDTFRDIGEPGTYNSTVKCDIQQWLIISDGHDFNNKYIHAILYPFSALWKLRFPHFNEQQQHIVSILTTNK